MGADGGGSVCAFFYKQLVKWGLWIDLPVKGKAVLQRNPDFFVVEVLDANLMLDRTIVLAGTPLPGQPQVWRGRFIDECHSLIADLAGVMIERPLQRTLAVANFRGVDQGLRSPIVPTLPSRHLQDGQAWCCVVRFNGDLGVGSAKMCARLARCAAPQGEKNQTDETDANHAWHEEGIGRSEARNIRSSGSASD